MTIKEQKRWFLLEIITGISVTLSLLTIVLLTSILKIHSWEKFLIISISFIQFIIGVILCLKIEQSIGLYQCKHCKHSYKPTFKNVLLAMHLGRTRYMKCPECNKKSWNKKTLENKM